MTPHLTPPLLRAVSRPLILATSFLALLLPLSAEETVLYQTDFSEFALGDDTLAGHDGWASSHTGQGLHGTIDNVFQQGNRAGTIGYNIPDDDDDVISLWRPIDLDPAARDSLIHFSTDLAIIDSDNDLYDSFYISVFNQDADLLGSVVFDNSADAFGLWRYDGKTFHDLDRGFDHDKIYTLALEIDFANNRWSANLDSLSLFKNASLTAGNRPLDLGDIAVEWEITEAGEPGTNWMYFDNWRVAEEKKSTTPPPQPALIAPQIRPLPNGNMRLSWRGMPGRAYVVERSQDLRQWNTAGSNASVTAGEDGRATFVDQQARGVDQRFYRVRRS